MLTVAIPQPVREMPGRWRQRAAERRALSTVDAASDALEAAAKELDAAIAASTDETRLLSTKEFAESRGVRDGTVRKWCARGELPGAVKRATNDWQIPAGATRTRKRRT